MMVSLSPWRVLVAKEGQALKRLDTWLASQVEELYTYISEMERIIEQLQTECPVEFGPQKKQIEESTGAMKKKYEDAMAAVFQF